MERYSITVREHARLTTSACYNTLDEAQISPSAFDWLCSLQSQFGKQGARLVVVEDRRWLRLDNYVGVLSTPCGTQIEILPKHYDREDSLEKSRVLLCKLISSALHISHRETGPAAVSIFRYPLSEWVIRQFLNALNLLVKRGLRFEYQQIEEEQRFLRGQLDLGRQMRQPETRQHLFHLRHDIFLPDRPENRLLRSALDKICRSTEQSENWRLAHELKEKIRDIKPSQLIKMDLACWRNDRLMAHYKEIKPWCAIVLGEHLPLAVSGEFSGISMLFPMERLFEQHVASVLQRQLLINASMRKQAANQHLCHHNGEGLFRLKPDIMIVNQAKRWVIDTKWKRITGKEAEGKYGLKEADFYQMLAYGMRYMEGEGDMVMIYPRSRDFTLPMPPFGLPASLQLHVWPFDLEHDELIMSDECDLPLNNCEKLINASGAERTLPLNEKNRHGIS